jgi:SSS family solute:Na+ symporter
MSANPTPADDPTDWIGVSYGLVVTTLVAVAVYALVYPTLIAKKYFASEGAALNDLEGFLTAKNTQSRWRIGFSFYAGSVGAWAITTPANYATWAGWVGMTFYAIACGVPIIVLAFFGDMVREKYPTAGALGDVIVIRFGPAMRYCTCVVALFNMAIFMLAEFTTIGALFRDFVGSEASPIIIVMGILTTAYSAYGGLLVSIVTDQIQAGVSILFLFVLSIYVWATFKQPLEPGFGELSPLLGPNFSGYSAIFVMPASLMAATIFNEGMWQRVWAAEDKTALRQGGVMGCVAVVIAIFLYGLFGFIAAWGGLVDYVNTNPNLYLFQVFKTSPDQPPNSVVDTAIEVVTLMLALVMSESAIDSLQNGITATLASTFLRGKPIMWARILCVLINILIIPFALENFSVLALFLPANMLGCCWFVPVLIGGVWDTKMGRKVISETTTVLGALGAILLVSLYGISDGPKQCVEMANAGALFPPLPDICHCASPDELGTLVLDELEYEPNCGSAGVEWAWIKHPYMIQHFVLVTFCSPVFCFLFGLINLQLPDTNPGLSDLLGLAGQRHELPQAAEEPPQKQAEMPPMQNQPVMMMMPGMQPAAVYGMPMMPPGPPVNVMMPTYPGAAQGLQWGSA